MTKHQFRSPLSGDVSQIIYTFWDLLFRPFWMNGFINIFQMDTEEPDLEQKIVQDVGSYGRQLGRIMDMVKILEKNVDLSKISEAERVMVRDFAELVWAVDREKRQNSAPSALNSVAQFLADIEFMKKYYPNDYSEVIKTFKFDLKNEVS